MSYIQFQQKCSKCERTWNAAFGVVGTQIIAEPPKKCPYCGAPEIEKFADGWKMDDGGETATIFETITDSIPFVFNKKND